MKKTLQAALVALMLMPTSAPAQDAAKGADAYKAGDYATALREWTPLAEQGNVFLQGMLGSMYYKGQGVAQDFTEAQKWVRMAAEQGDARAQGMLGFMYERGKGVAQDYTEAYMWFIISSANGDRDASSKRDDLAQKMTPAQVAEAQRMARECVANGLQSC